MEISKDNDYATINLIDFEYLSKHCNILQQIKLLKGAGKAKCNTTN